MPALKSAPPVTDIAPPPSIAEIFSVFFRIGLLSFGGGLTGWVFREVVTLRNWMDEDDFMSGLAMSQILPGTNVSNLAIYVGHRLRGAGGVAAALVGLFVGPFFAVIGLASVYATLRELPFADAAMDGIAAAAIGMLLIIIGRGARRSAKSPVALAAIAATFVAVALLHWSLPVTVVSVGIVSVAVVWFREAPDAG